MRLCLILLIAGLLFLPGCNQQNLPEGMPRLTLVTLTIMQDGAPLEGAVVSLLPEEAGSQWNAGGVTDASGRAKMRTLAQYDGVAPGKYKVTVAKTVSEPIPDWFATATEAERMAYRSPPPVQHVHSRFANRNVTPLELEVGSSAITQTFEVERP